MSVRDPEGHEAAPAARLPGPEGGHRLPVHPPALAAARGVQEVPDQRGRREASLRTSREPKQRTRVTEAEAEESLCW